MRDKDKAFTVIEATWRATDHIGCFFLCPDDGCSISAFSGMLLQKEASVVLRFGGLDIELCRF